MSRVVLNNLLLESNTARNVNKIGRVRRYAKCVLVFFNVFVALFSLAVLGFGIESLRTWSAQEWPKHQPAVAPWPWVFVAIGAVIFVTACFGCCGVRDSYCILVTYVIFLVVIIMGQLAFAAHMYIHADSIHEDIMTGLNKIFDGRTADEGAAASALFNDIQQKLECCGKNGPNDYDILLLHHSCCTHEKKLDNIFGGSCKITEANTIGCAVRTSELFLKWNKIFANLVMIVVCVAGVGAIFALLYILFIPFTELSVGRVPLPDRTSRQVEENTYSHPSTTLSSDKHVI